MNNYIALCLFCKDENEYLEEWINYHLFIGVNHIFIYDNNSTIAIKNTVKNYIDEKQVTVIEVTDNNPGRQCRAYNKCIIEHGYKFNWIGFIDTDEFIVIKNGMNIIEFLKPYENFAALGIYWLCFGSNGKKKKQKSQIKSYTMRSEYTFHANNHIKSIVQPKYVKNKVSADPHTFIYNPGYFQVDENKNKLSGPIGIHTSNKIQLNHYVLRSLEDFENKMKRGGGNSGNIGRKNMHFFNTYDDNCNLIKDEIINKLYK